MIDEVIIDDGIGQVDLARVAGLVSGRQSESYCWHVRAVLNDSLLHAQSTSSDQTSPRPSSVRSCRLYVGKKTAHRSFSIGCADPPAIATSE